MFREAKVMFMYTETSLHCGSGSSLGVVDLPIQRKNIPIFPFAKHLLSKACKGMV